LDHRIHELLNGSEVVLPKPLVRERDPELEERMERLRNQQLNREYENMTTNLR